MATLKQLKAEADKHGAELHINREFGEATALLPEESEEEWINTSAKCAVVSYGYTGMMPSVYDDLIELMKDGIV